MGSNFNYKGFGNDSEIEGGGRTSGSFNFPLSRQQSIYSLTFDEFQNTIGGSGKDFGSMNMDELLKNIWSAEATQNTAAAGGGGGGGASHGGQEMGNYNHGGGYLQRQGSLTLPRTLSLKTVDEVWRDISKDFGGGNPGCNVTQRQQTLGEITLEEFLARAGVVREDTLLPNKNEGVFFGDLGLSSSSGNPGFGINFQQPSRGIGLMGTQIESTNQNTMQASNLQMNVNNGVRSSQQQTTPPRLALQPPQQQPIFPKQNAVSYATSMAMPSNAQMGGTGLRGGLVGLDNMAQGAGIQGGGLALAAMGGGGIGVATVSSPVLSSDGVARSSGDTASVSPVPFLFNGGLRGRKYNNAVEKVIERRQRRMIKNRESAARSRARKQAYTMELEQEVAKLKEENQELRKKQAELMEQQKKQEMEMKKAQQQQQYGPKRRCLRRTSTGPW